MYTGAILVSPPYRGHFLVCFHTRAFEGNYSNEKLEYRLRRPGLLLDFWVSLESGRYYGIQYPFIYGNQTPLDSSKKKLTFFNNSQSGSHTAILQNSEHILNYFIHYCNNLLKTLSCWNKWSMSVCEDFCPWAKYQTEGPVKMNAQLYHYHCTLGWRNSLSHWGMTLTRRSRILKKSKTIIS